MIDYLINYWQVLNQAMSKGTVSAQAIILSLAAVGNIGPVKIRAILSRIERASDILDWDSYKFKQIPGISDEITVRIKTKLDLNYGRRLEEWADKNGINILTLLDEDYPQSLSEIYDPPPFLFIKGNLGPSDINAVALVGSRNASEYGRMTASKLAGELAANGVTIVSGMAIGIDSSSHRGALQTGGRTLAVLGSGIDVIYPRENKRLYGEISENGAVISEFFPGTEPNSGHFPRRNRVISGLSKAVIVVEAGQKSGALLTADLALSQGKALFAVPGQLSSRQSMGANDLIKTGARILTSPEDIFSVLPELKNDYIAPDKKIVEELSEGENLIFDFLSDSPKQIDYLVRKSGMTANGVSGFLLSLELRGLIKQLSGKRFIAV
ncbi:MAG: DNA-processing protein DprA [candidate division Zixibacteria bacterium]